MLVVDAHLDLAWNALNWNRDLTIPVAEIRRQEAGMKEDYRGANTVSLPEMRKAEVVICLATVLARIADLGDSKLDYRNQEIACAMARGQLAYYRLQEEQGRLRMLKTWREIESHLGEWQAGKGLTCPLGFILSMEGADPILSARQLDEWWDDGLRVVGLAHYGKSAYAHGTGATGRLSVAGVELLAAMDRLGLALDMTHLSEEGFWQALEKFKGPVLASHNNCRALIPGDRQFSDEQIRALIAREAVIGTAFDSWMLYPGYIPLVTDNSLVSLDRVADHIEHICQLAGNARHAAIGSDLDGGFGREQSPHDLDTIVDLQRIPELLRRRGYAEVDVEAVMHGNWLRFFRRAWPAENGPRVG